MFLFCHLLANLKRWPLFCYIKSNLLAYNLSTNFMCYFIRIRTIKWKPITSVHPPQYQSKNYIKCYFVCVCCSAVVLVIFVFPVLTLILGLFRIYSTLDEIIFLLHFLYYFSVNNNERRVPLYIKWCYYCITVVFLWLTIQGGCATSYIILWH